MDNQIGNSSLFRKEIFSKPDDRGLGAIKLSQPISSVLITASSLTISLALISFLYFGTYTKKARISGITVPEEGMITINTSSGGVLLKTFLKEGDVVKEGEPIFEISTERQSIHGEVTERMAAQIDKRMDTLINEKNSNELQFTEKNKLVEDKLNIVESDLNQMEYQISQLKKRLTLMQEDFFRLKALEVGGYISKNQIQQKKLDLIDIETRLSELERAKLQIEASKINYRSEKKLLAETLTMEKIKINRSISILDQENIENENRKSNVIISPYSGIITALTVKNGQSITPGQSLGTLIPHKKSCYKKSNYNIEKKCSLLNSINSDLEVHLYAPSKTAGFVSVGQSVSIRYAAFPYQKFGLQKGIVSEVSLTPFSPTELPSNMASTILAGANNGLSGGVANEALYRVKVKLSKQTIDLYGNEKDLKFGMTLEADVLQDKRKIWEWIAEPIIAVSRR